MSMLWNWVVVAWRALARDKAVAGLNIAGLALGFLACTLIAAYLRAETGHDRSWPDAERVVRIGFDFPVTGRGTNRAQTSAAQLAPLVQAEVQGVEAVARLRPARVTAKVGDRAFPEVVGFADPGFADLFPLPVLAGDPRAALAEPNSLVLAEGAARRLLGMGAEALGKLVLVEGTPMRVGAVVGDWPRASYLDLGLLASWTSAPNPAQKQAERDGWFYLGTHSFARLRPGLGPADIAPALADLLERHIPANQRPDGVARVAEFATARPDPLPAIHLSNTGTAGSGVRPAGSLAAVQAFAAVALLVLLMAGLNFATLTAALAGRRRREAAVRKALGGTRRGLVGQFLLEASLAALAALALALVAAELALPWLARALGGQVALDSLLSPTVLAGAAALALAVGLLAGTGPALALAATPAADTLRGGGVAGGSRGRGREALVALQFATGIALGLAASVVHLQTEHLRAVPPGYQAEGLVVLSGLEKPAARQAWPALRDGLQADPRIRGAALSNTVPGASAEAITSIRPADRPNAAAVDVTLLQVGDGFVETYGARLLAGRPLEEARDSAGGTALLNAAAVRRLGLADPAQALGLAVSTVADRRGTYTVVGVVDDMQMRPGREAALPALLLFEPAAAGFATIRLDPADEAGALAHLDATWARLLPDLPLRRVFLSDQLDALHGAEARQARVLAAFAGLAVAVACLGLLGMSGLSARRRTREVALRKVLGAGAGDIARLMLWDGLRPVLLAAAVACPAAWLGMGWWLEGYAARVSLGPGLFLVAVGTALALAVATLAVYGTRAALARPAEALRAE